MRRSKSNNKNSKISNKKSDKKNDKTQDKEEEIWSKSKSSERSVKTNVNKSQDVYKEKKKIEKELVKKTEDVKKTIDQIETIIKDKAVKKDNPEKKLEEFLDKKDIEEISEKINTLLGDDKLSGQLQAVDDLKQQTSKISRSVKRDNKITIPPREVKEEEDFKMGNNQTRGLGVKNDPLETQIKKIKEDFSKKIKESQINTLLNNNSSPRKPNEESENSLGKLGNKIDKLKNAPPLQQFLSSASEKVLRSNTPQPVQIFSDESEEVKEGFVDSESSTENELEDIQNKEREYAASLLEHFQNTEDIEPEVSPWNPSQVDVPDDATAVDESEALELGAKINLKNLGIFDSYPTYPFGTINLPDPEPDTDNCEFVYNYYTVDESENRKNNKLFTSEANLVTVSDVENANRSKYSLPPRYMKIKFSTNLGAFESFAQDNKFDENNVLIKHLKSTDFLKQLEQNNSNDLLARVLIEGGLSSPMYSSTSIIDTDLDAKAYERLFSAINIAGRTVQNLDEITLSPGEMVKSYIDRTKLDDFENTNLNSGELLKSLVGNINMSDSIVVSRKENINAIRDNVIRDKVKFASFSAIFDNSQLHNIVDASDLEFGGLFENEVASFKNASDNLRIHAANRFSLDPEQSIDDYESVVPPSSVVAVLGYDEDNPPLEPVAPYITHIGYMIEKVEISSQGSRVLKPFFIGPNRTDFIDVDVLYGRDYVYKIRTLALYEYDFVNTNLFDAAASHAFRGAFLIASSFSPVRLSAIERVPPSPPIMLKFSYSISNDYLQISWIPPHNPQQDVVGYRIFKRKSLDEPYTLIGEYDFDKTSPDFKVSRAYVPSNRRYILDGPLTNFVDTEYTYGETAIYAVSCFDAHGLDSSYSPQYLVSFDKSASRVTYKSIISAGSPIPYPNMNLKLDTFKDTIKTSGKNRMTVYFNPEFYKTKKRVDNVQVSEKTFADNSDGDMCYRINMINTDIQKSKNIDINIRDESFEFETIDPKIIEDTNLSFNFKDRY